MGRKTGKIHNTLVLWYFAIKLLRSFPRKRNFLIRSPNPGRGNVRPQKGMIVSASFAVCLYYSLQTFYASWQAFI
jgi:hypothetical protein